MSEERSIYIICDTYEDALAKTDEGLAPIIVMVKTISDLTLPDIGYEVSDASAPRALLSLSTVFNKERYNGKIGWFPLPVDVRILLGDLIINNDSLSENEWIYFAQQWESRNE